jgi:hypothetical protein
VTLETVITAFCAGATAEEISQRFPTVTLADVYQIIAHYLTHTTEIDAYRSQRQSEAAALKVEVESRFDPVGVRARLLARQKAAQTT